MNWLVVLKNVLIMITRCSQAIVKDFITLRCLYAKKFFKTRKNLKISAIISVVLICYAFGVFTHLFEKSLSEFETPLKTGIRQALLDLKPDQSIDNIKDINNLNYQFIHDARQTCHTLDMKINNEGIQSQPYLVILVKSKLTHFEERRLIRKTWAAKDEIHLIRTVFLIGSPDFNTETNNDQIMEDTNKLETENREFNDIVQQNFYDNYYNNTLKTMMGIKWINQYCSNSKYYMFIDDDFFLNPRQLMSYLKNNVTTKMYDDLYGGYVFPNSSPMRHMISKWYITLDEYPYRKFPPFIAAGCYVLSIKSARLFYMASKLIKLFRFDDIYMAILAHNIGIEPMNIENVKYYSPTYEPNLYASNVIAAHGFKGKELSDIWNELKSLIYFDSFKSYKEYIY